jgi:acyl-CoA synthetase (NDP forming)
VVVVVGSSAQFHPQLSVEPIVHAQRGAKPLAVYCVPDAPESLALLAAAGIAAFRTPESCADALCALLAWRAPAAAVDAGSVAHGAIARALAGGIAHGFDEARASAVFAALGVPVAPQQVLRGADEPVRIAFPVAVKLLSSSITHKTELGGVVLGVADAGGVRDAIAGIAAATAAHGHGAQAYLLQSMCTGVGEAVVGYRRDAETGPLVSVGMGGRLTEIYKDVALRLAPVDASGAREMIAEVAGFAALRGFRGLPRGDLEALAQAVAAMSRLALVDAPCIAEAEINPLIVGREGEGVVAVDAVLVLEQQPPAPPSEAARPPRA